MSLISKPIDELTMADLLTLIADGEIERRTIEYKVTLPGNRDEDKREFATDLASFANGGGGHLIYGMRAENGLPKELIGIATDEADDGQLRLEQVMRAWIEPRLTGVQLRAIPLDRGKTALVIYIPRSWNRPHAVTHRGAPGSMRFYSRDGNGKYPLDVAQIRASFVGAETAAARIRDFRVDRLAQIISGETAVSLRKGPMAILHLVPIGAFELGTHVDLSALSSGRSGLQPRSYTREANDRHNFDGFLSYEPVPDAANSARSYTQVFRNGIVEDVDADGLHSFDGSRDLPTTSFEEELILTLPRRLRLQRDLGVDLPVVLMLSLINVKGYTIDARHPLSSRRLDPIDRDVLALPDSILDSYECDPAKELKPSFDIIWNAAGYSKCVNYDDQGNRKSRK